MQRFIIHFIKLLSLANLPFVQYNTKSSLSLLYANAKQDRARLFHGTGTVLLNIRLAENNDTMETMKVLLPGGKKLVASVNEALAENNNNSQSETGDYAMPAVVTLYGPANRSSWLESVCAPSRQSWTFITSLLAIVSFVNTILLLLANYQMYRAFQSRGVESPESISATVRTASLLQAVSITGPLLVWSLCECRVSPFLAPLGLALAMIVWWPIVQAHGKQQKETITTGLGQTVSPNVGEIVSTVPLPIATDLGQTASPNVGETVSTVPIAIPGFWTKIVLLLNTLWIQFMTKLQLLGIVKAPISIDTGKDLPAGVPVDTKTLVTTEPATLGVVAEKDLPANVPVNTKTLVTAEPATALAAGEIDTRSLPSDHRHQELLDFAANVSDPSARRSFITQLSFRNNNLDTSQKSLSVNSLQQKDDAKSCDSEHEGPTVDEKSANNEQKEESNEPNEPLLPSPSDDKVVSTADTDKDDVTGSTNSVPNPSDILFTLTDLFSLFSEILVLALNLFMSLLTFFLCLLGVPEKTIVAAESQLPFQSSSENSVNRSKDTSTTLTKKDFVVKRGSFLRSSSSSLSTLLFLAGRKTQNINDKEEDAETADTTVDAPLEAFISEPFMEHGELHVIRQPGYNYNRKTTPVLNDSCEELVGISESCDTNNENQSSQSLANEAIMSKKSYDDENDDNIPYATSFDFVMNEALSKLNTTSESCNVQTETPTLSENDFDERAREKEIVVLNNSHQPPLTMNETVSEKRNDDSAAFKYDSVREMFDFSDYEDAPFDEPLKEEEMSRELHMSNGVIGNRAVFNDDSDQIPAADDVSHCKDAGNQDLSTSKSRNPAMLERNPESLMLEIGTNDDSENHIYIDGDDDSYANYDKDDRQDIGRRSYSGNEMLDSERDTFAAGDSTTSLIEEIPSLDTMDSEDTDDQPPTDFNVHWVKNEGTLIHF